MICRRVVDRLVSEVPVVMERVVRQVQLVEQQRHHRVGEATQVVAGHAGVGC